MATKDKCLKSFPEWVKTRVNLALEYKFNDVSKWYLEEFVDHNNYEKCVFKAWYLTANSLISLCLSLDQIHVIEYFKKAIMKIETAMEVIEDEQINKEIACIYSFKIKFLNGDIITLNKPELNRADYKNLYIDFMETLRQSL
ncbi:MAG: hypothetical protein K0R78_3305 [Pelosinus sp.]|jgi:hypothetical protein|nr:hypothetical protein [Pelosinus sp.]